MRRSSRFTLVAFSVLFGLASLHCLGEDVSSSDAIDPNADASAGDGSPNGSSGGPNAPDGSTPTGDGGDQDSGEPATPPHLPVTDSYLKSPSPHVSASFGTSIALSADGNTVAIGSSGEDSAATGVNNTAPGPGDRSADSAGAVFVFVRDQAGAWSQQAYIKAPNTAASQLFGRSVSLSSDGNRLAVGATGESTTANGSGAVYVYNRTGSNWTHGASLKPPNAMQNGMFGYSVALAGDGQSLVVGSFGESGTGTGISTVANGTFTNASVYHGAVYRFAFGAGNWSFTHYFKPSVFKAGCRFGASVALSGDGRVLLVGAQSESSATTGVSTSAAMDTGADGSGAVYVFESNLGTWTQTAFVKPSTTRPNQRFGVSLAMAADASTFVVGSNFETSGAKGVNGNQNDTTATNAGAAYVFAKNAASVYEQTAYLKASNTRSNANFGQNLAMSLDGKTVVVGSSPESSAATGVNGSQDDTSLPSAGAAYVFNLVGGAWTQTAYLKQFRPTPRATNFGSALATTNGGRTIVVGASADPSSDTGVNGTVNDTTASGSGAVFTFK